MAINREARLREVLAEVNVLDLWSATKSILSYWGCLAIFLIVVTTLSSLAGDAIGIKYEFDIPDWVVWLFFIWAFITIYTSEKSFHEHKFSWYFPRIGWLWSIPVAGYLLVGIQIYRIAAPDAEFLVKATYLALLVAWWFPSFLGISILEIGHSRLMEKRCEEGIDQ